ncbi:hypothetical protein ACFL4R_00065 [Nitrospirota bacterium]
MKEGPWLTGVGSGATSWVTAEANLSNRHVHNVLIYSLAFGGVFELMLVVFIIAWLVRIAIRHMNGSGIVLLAFMTGIFVRNFAETTGLLFGNLNNPWVYLSWYALITIIVMISFDIKGMSVSPVGKDYG